MVRGRARRNCKRRIIGLFRPYAESASYLLFAGTSFSHQRGIRWLASPFAAANRQTIDGEKTDAQVGRAGKFGFTVARGTGDQIHAGGAGSSECVGDDARGGNRTRYGTGAIRNSRWAASARGATDFRGRSRNELQDLAGADAANRTGRLVCWLARQRFICT